MIIIISGEEEILLKIKKLFRMSLTRARLKNSSKRNFKN